MVFAELHTLALLCLVSSCLFSILRAAHLIILILHEVIAEKDGYLSQVFACLEAFFSTVADLLICWEKYQLYLLSLSFKASLVLNSVLNRNSTVHFSFFCQSRTFAILTLPFAQLFLPSVFCEYPTYTQSQALQAGERGGAAEILRYSWTGTPRNLVIPSLIQPCSSLI